MPYIHVNGFNLYYETAGQGAPVVFVHGGFPSLSTRLNDFSQWHWTWENDFAALFRFIYEELAELIPAARKHIVAGEGHSLVHRSVTGRRVVIDFLQETKSQLL